MHSRYLCEHLDSAGSYVCSKLSSHIYNMQPGAREVEGWTDGLTNMTFFGGRHSNRIEIVVFLFMATLVLATVSHIDCPPSYEGPA